MSKQTTQTPEAQATQTLRPGQLEEARLASSPVALEEALAEFALSALPAEPVVVGAVRIPSRRRPGPCLCGCGALRSAGRFFAPGHDARLASWFRAVAADGPEALDDDERARAKAAAPHVRSPYLRTWRDAAVAKGL